MFQCRPDSVHVEEEEQIIEQDTEEQEEDPANFESSPSEGEII